VLLVAAAELAAGQPLEACATCTCGEIAAIELTCAELAEFNAMRVAGRTHVEVGALRLRLPRGLDQLHWLAFAQASDTDLARDMLGRLVEGGGALTDGDVVAAERALAEADPLVDFRAETACPECGTALTMEVDLETVSLGRLRRAQRTLLEEVHALASAYHWSEAQIASLPAWRRAEYLALIERRR
jgi:hypothetical protein